MKTMKIGITALAAIVISGAIFYSCNKEEKSTTPVIKQENKTLKDVSAGDYFTYSNNPICLGDEVTITLWDGVSDSDNENWWHTVIRIDQDDDYTEGDESNNLWYCNYSICD